MFSWGCVRCAWPSAKLLSCLRQAAPLKLDLFALKDGSVRLCKGDNNKPKQVSSVRCMAPFMYRGNQAWNCEQLFSQSLVRCASSQELLLCIHFYYCFWEQTINFIKVKTSPTDTFGGQTAVRWTGRARLSVQRGVFKHDLEGKLFGTGQNRSFKRGVRLTRVFVRRGSTVLFASTAVLFASTACTQNKRILKILSSRANILINVSYHFH